MVDLVVVSLVVEGVVGLVEGLMGGLMEGLFGIGDDADPLSSNDLGTDDDCLSTDFWTGDVHPSSSNDLHFLFSNDFGNDYDLSPPLPRRGLRGQSRWLVRW